MKTITTLAIAFSLYSAILLLLESTGILSIVITQLSALLDNPPAWENNALTILILIALFLTITISRKTTNKKIEEITNRLKSAEDTISNFKDKEKSEIRITKDTVEEIANLLISKDKVPEEKTNDNLSQLKSSIDESILSEVAAHGAKLDVIRESLSDLETKIFNITQSINDALTKATKELKEATTSPDITIPQLNAAQAFLNEGGHKLTITPSGQNEQLDKLTKMIEALAKPGTTDTS